MKKTLTKVLALVLCFAMVAAFAACSGKTDTETTTAGDGTTAADEGTTVAADFTKAGQYTASNTEYFIGCTGPLTGNVSSYGISVKQGAELAVKEINAKGGLNGVNFKFDMKDDKAAAADATTGYDALYEAGMQIALGSVTSGACEAFAQSAKEDKLFFMTPSASAANVIADNDYAFRVCFGDPDQGTLAAKELTKTYSKIGAIYDTSDPYSSGIYDAFKAEMATLNVTYTERTFDSENKNDFSTQVEALKDCDAIFMPIYYTEAGLIAKACVAKGCTAVLFGCDGFDGIKDQIDATVKNKIMYITPFDAAATDTATSAFVAAYKAAYNATPDQFAADGYDAVMIIFEAMKAAGVNNVTVAPDVLGDAVVAAVTAADFSYKGLTGDMTWDTTGACAKVPNIVELG